MEPVWPFIREIAVPIYLGLVVCGLAALFVLKEFGSTGLKWFLAATIFVSGGLATYFFYTSSAVGWHPNRYGRIMFAIIGTIIGSWAVLAAFFWAMTHSLSKTLPETETNQCPSS